MKSITELEEIRKKALENMQLRKNDNGRKIIVGMATCGIAAGARPVMLKFIEELKKRGITDTHVTMTGCIGLCRLEPIVEVYELDGSKITYVNMTPEKAVRVVTEHIVNGRICSDLTIGNSNAED
jgi:NADP-reducing hydrogenase subunit HndB